MARKTFIRISFLIIFFMIWVIAPANVTASHSAVRKSNKEMKLNGSTESKNQTMNDKMPVNKPGKMDTGPEKEKKPVAEELAHIHHFHKERVKKIKRHHEKFWIVAKVLLVVCHVVLLICAFLHVAH